MAYCSKSYRLKYVSANGEKIRLIRRRFYRNHLESEKLRFKKMYIYKKEALRMRMILIDDL